MAYSELIKNFSKIREYVRQFYVYGFRSRGDYDYKSARSYDNEHRRVQSWLGDYMHFRHENEGKVVFLSVDSRSCSSNPLYVAFKAKSFTDNDIVFHFYLMDLLCYGEELSLKEILDRFEEDYLSFFNGEFSFDESSVRKKLKEYVELGMVKERREQKTILYRRSDRDINEASLSDAVEFFSESDPLGLIGSYILDRRGAKGDFFRFKHHYIFHAIDSEIVYGLVTAMEQGKSVDIELKNEGRGYLPDGCVFPIRICVSTQTGRQYLLGYHKGLCRIIMVRLDNVCKLCEVAGEEDRELYLSAYDEFRRHQWGVSVSPDMHTEHIEMIVRAGRDEQYIVKRLEREKRCGHIQHLYGDRYLFTADVYDALEVLPWIRTFIGRIESFECSDPSLEERFYRDIESMIRLYGGDDDVIS